ncbi:hypothetical protein [Parvularcula sp. IMCC14364]|uniref:hypothetical protein n=1 Tax=Parvularcula sp. IMCC14364 TaxID=3067902 RepID=UPI002740BF04|nr:hypothetical protein [Parvularcula sp. IMCC14364]
MLKKSLLSFASLFVLGAGAALGGEWEATTEIGAEARLFLNDPVFQGQSDDTVQPSLTFESDIRWRSDDGKHEFVFIPFMRADSVDDQRTHADLREGYYRYLSDGDWSLLAGVAKVFWGTTESRHLVDIVNQTDAVEDIDEEDKLGQPMVMLSYLKDWGQLDFFILPFFRDRIFPGEEGRLRTPFVVNDDDVFFSDDEKRDVVDYAIRYAQYFGDWDVGLSLFNGVSREPRLVSPLTTSGSTAEFFQLYDRITQAGLDLQYTKDAWLWKFEGIVREGQGDTYTAAVAGFEYTLYQIFEKPWDLGILGEYLYDGRDDDIVLVAQGATTAAPITAFENDVFAGARLALNDIQDTAILAGAIVDADDSSTALFIEAERRLGQSWTIELESRLFLNVDDENIFAAFEEDDFLNIRLAKYF